MRMNSNRIMNTIFENRYLLRGTFKGKGFEVKNCDCDVTINPLDTSTMIAKIYAQPENTGLDYLNLPITDWKEVEFSDNIPGHPSHLRGRIRLQSHTNSFGVIAEIETKDFTKYTVYTDNDFTADKLTMDFTLSQCNLFQLGYMSKVDRKKGYQRGVDPWTGKFEDESITVTFTWGTMSFSRGLYLSRKDKLDATSVLAEPAVVSVTHKCEPKDINLIWTEAENLIKEILPLLSFVDGQKVEWTSVDTYAELNEKKIMVVEQYQSIPKLNYRYHSEPDVNRYRTLRYQFCLLMEKYLTLEATLRVSMKKAIDPYLLGSNQEFPIKVAIMLFQSAIEVFVKQFASSVESKIAEWGYPKGKTPTASMRIVGLLEAYHIDINKYYPELEIQSIKKDRAQLPFVEFRNNIMHEGDFPLNGTEEEAQIHAKNMDEIFRVLLYSILVEHGSQMPGFKILSNNEPDSMNQ